MLLRVAILCEYAIKLLICRTVCECIIHEKEHLHLQSKIAVIEKMLVSVGGLIYCKLCCSTPELLTIEKIANTFSFVLAVAYGWSRSSGSTAEGAWAESTGIVHQVPRSQKIRSRNFACEYCGRKFSNKRDCMGHVNSAHLHRKPFVCDLCQRSFAGKKTLNNHRKICVVFLSGP